MIKNTKNISTVLSFITQVQKNNYEKDYTYFYRGHSNYSYNLTPSIYRDSGFIENEDIMFRELISHNPNDFSECKYAIDYLVKMQHYGLPTRLLDITTNPLVALFFACNCKENKTKHSKTLNLSKGEVIVFKIHNSHIKYFDSDSVSILSNISKIKNEFNYNNSIKSNRSFNNQPYIKELTQLIRLENSSFNPNIKESDLNSVICIKAKMGNPRIINQSGAFLLFGCNGDKKNCPSIPDEWIASKERLIITNGSKMLENLQLMGITESFIYPHLDKFSEYLKNQYSSNN